MCSSLPAGHETRPTANLKQIQLAHKRHIGANVEVTGLSALQSWVNIAIMSERVGVDVWSRGSGEGWSIQEALDYNLDLTEDSSIAYPLTQGEDSTSPPSPAQSPASSPSSDTASEADAEPEAGSVSRSVCASSTNQAVLALVLLATTMVLYVHE